MESSTQDKLSTLFPLREAVTDIEKKAIKHALYMTGGNKTKAASLLQIDYKTILSKIRKYNITLLTME